ncbi:MULTISPECIES: replication-associated recombination protein A [unclassified Wenzhouxiangella]|uniref:replication-associated recombination protein A n=1 Tax=unclassified Wenzhouxiangella TaxID=2613841 RepID=UPI000E325F6B|nr:MULTISPECIES: replication-associated recombination protein A [unclassified Wenzhouxiangella]RFF27616.1 replication-associated recombination protein A [Wenzhouxiangella sp. 15181]RFP70140.1 replication-associated recombination protein A [Wenzhouxiangella sp. 15190]
MSDLFATEETDHAPGGPLADRLRPKHFDDVVGQDHLLGDQGPLRRMIDSGRVASLVFWGPPGTGKTTLARLLAQVGDLAFVQISAIFSGVGDLKKIFEAAKMRRRNGQGTLLFVDEIHRFNRAQQDSFLPHVEDGTIILVGATTENPSFELNGALLSRMQVLVLQRLDHQALDRLLERAEAHVERKLPVDDEAREMLLAMADGDGRYLLNMAEAIYELAADGETIDSERLMGLVQRRAPAYDKDREEHYNLISALHKSLRGSDADAALYWLARMLVGGEDPLYVARRLIRFASEDVGLADPQALTQALAAREAYEVLGSPEGELAIVQATLYLATAPKSNAIYTAAGMAWRAAKESGSLMPPAHILNAPTALMKDLGYGKDYVYDHHTDKGFSGQNYFPDEMERQRFYRPVERGFEREVLRRLDWWERQRGRS